jgi:hypothetical protein
MKIIKITIIDTFSSPAVAVVVKKDGGFIKAKLSTRQVAPKILEENSCKYLKRKSTKTVFCCIIYVKRRNT